MGLLNQISLQIHLGGFVVWLHRSDVSLELSNLSIVQNNGNKFNQECQFYFEEEDQLIRWSVNLVLYFTTRWLQRLGPLVYA